MRVFLGADHNGFEDKQALGSYLQKQGYDVTDVGDNTLDPQDDFPVFAAQVVKDVLAGDDDARGILLCGSGQGMCMAANRYKGIRAALGYNTSSVRASRNDDDANVLCLPASELDAGQICELAELFLSVGFAQAPRFIRRIHELDELGS